MTKEAKTCIAHDPGTKQKTEKDRGSYAYAVLRGNLNKRGMLNLVVIRNGTLPATVSQIKRGKEHHSQLSRYLNLNKLMFEKYRPDFFVAERFMTRGIKGMTVESVNMMLGALVSRVGIPYALYPAVTWKVEIKKWGINLEKMYKIAAVSPHQIDAVMMGAFALSRSLGAKRTKLNVRLLIKQIEETSRTKLINKARRR
jgi:hypothetical protein